MGGQAPVKQAPRKATIDDAILDVRLFGKQLKTQASKAQKESESLTNKAKNLLKNGDEENAELFLQNALAKKTQYSNCMKMSARMEYVENMMKNSKNQEEMLRQYQKLNPILSTQLSSSTDPEKFFKVLEDFEKHTDNIKANNDVMMEKAVGDQSEEIGEHMKNLKKQLMFEASLKEVDEKKKIDVDLKLQKLTQL